MAARSGLSTRSKPFSKDSQFSDLRATNRPLHGGNPCKREEQKRDTANEAGPNFQLSKQEHPIGGCTMTIDKDGEASNPKVGKPDVDLDEARRFLSLLAPKAKVWWVQTFDDRRANRGKRLTTKRHASFEDLAEELVLLNEGKAGVF